jgi:ribosomal protein L10
VPTQEKVQSVESLRERLGTAKTAVLTEYRGLTVRQISDLRKQLKAASAEYKVIKNRLARLAVKDLALDALGAHFKGPTGLVFTAKDPVPVAKALQTFGGPTRRSIKLGFVEEGRPARGAGPWRTCSLGRASCRGPAGSASLVSLLTAPQRELPGSRPERADPTTTEHSQRHRMAANIEEIAEKLDTLTLLEAAQLSKLLQEKWGVSAAAAVAVAAAAAGGGAGEFDVILNAAGDKRSRSSRW